MHARGVAWDRSMSRAEWDCLSTHYLLVIPDANTRIAKTTMKTAMTSKTNRVIVISTPSAVARDTAMDRF
jgi:hypothetical protein